MKIVHVIEPLAAGMVTFVKSLVENLPDDQHIVIHGKREHVTQFSTVKKQFANTRTRFIHWRSAKRALGLHDLRAFLELWTILYRLKKNDSVDVVHLHCSKAGFLGRLVCRLLGIQKQVIYTPNGAPFLAGTNNLSNGFYKLLEKIATTLFGGQTVCCSPSEQAAYKKAGIRTIIINNGIEYSKNRAKNRTNQKKDGTFRIITSGRIVDQKDPLLFNKIAVAFRDFQNFEFIWVGDGEYRDLLSSPNIQVTGWLSPDKVAAIVAEGDVYLSTAKYEGLPFAVLEAMAMNMPMLLSNCTGNKDLINDLNGAVFTDEQEAVYRIMQFYNNASMLNVMGQHSGTYCRKYFNLRDTFRLYEKLYHQASALAALHYSI